MKDSPKPRLRHRIEYVAGRAALSVINLMPERIAYGAVAGVGRLFFRCSKRRQKIALRLLRNAYPDRSEAELLRLARIATGNIFRVVLDTIRVIPWVAKGRLAERVDVSALHEQNPKGAWLGLTAHLGSWEVGAIAIAGELGESHAIARSFKNPLMAAYLLGNRRRAGLHVHPRRGGIRDLARALERGHIGLQVVDQNQRLRGVFVPFFGELASTERAAATLAVRHGYPIRIGRAIRIGGGFRFKMYLTEEIPVARTGDRERDVEQTVREVNRRIEEHILEHPEQYLWIHDRYRTRPEPQAALEPQPEPSTEHDPAS